MKILIETDLGRDPDDLLALIYLMECNVTISALLLSPGHKDQVAVAHLVRDMYGGHFPIGVTEKALKESEKRSSNKFHMDILDRYKFPQVAEADDLGWLLAEEKIDESEKIFIIGPPKNMYRYLESRFGKEEDTITINKSVYMQGGFCPYSLHTPEVVLDKFRGLECCPSFNPNGEKRFIPLAVSRFARMNMIGKNICHTIEYDRSKNITFKSPNLNVFFNQHLHKAKKLHDVVAAVAMMFPHWFTWINGYPARGIKGGWTSVRSTMPWHKVAVDVNRERFWNNLIEIGSFT